MIDVTTGIAPPGAGAPPPGEEPGVDVTIWITEADGTRRMASVTVPDPDSQQLADTLVACLLGVGCLRGPALRAAVERRIR